MTRPERSPALAGVTTAAYLVPVIGEVAALLGAAERVLAACARAEDQHAERAVAIAASVDPATLPVGAVVGAGLPVPLAGRLAHRALHRLGAALHPVLGEAAGDGPVGFRVVSVDTTDLALLGQAAAQLTNRHRTRHGALGDALHALGGAPGEPPDHQHPAALGCLLAVLVPVVDPAAVALAEVAGDRVPLDPAARQAHRDVQARVLARLHRAR
ncbi:hypothetical protein [Actinomycetospora atypica]|uniref:DUF222 domain-containing protein n=1 Tax=Actinomycetospora atypica TaxID=1290095 RepID=A0ABV9YKL5_9PSEU